MIGASVGKAMASGLSMSDSASFFFSSTGPQPVDNISSTGTEDMIGQ